MECVTPRRDEVPIKLIRTSAFTGHLGPKLRKMQP